MISHATDKRKRQTYSSKDFAEIRSNCVATNIGKANRIVGRIYEEAFRDVGISSPQFALLVVLAIKESATAGELAEELGADPSTVSRNTELMVKRGLICVHTGTDRRVRTYCLSDEGNETVQASVAQWKKAQRTALRRIGRSSWRDLRRALRRFVMG